MTKTLLDLWNSAVQAAQSSLTSTPTTATALDVSKACDAAFEQSGYDASKHYNWWKSAFMQNRATAIVLSAQDADTAQTSPQTVPKFTNIVPVRGMVPAPTAPAPTV